MPNFAANISRLWREIPLMDRFEAARLAGFAGVAVPYPYDAPAKDIQRALLVNGLVLVRTAAPPPNYTGGARGFASMVGQEDRFAYDLRRAVRYCEALQVPVLTIDVGSGTGAAARQCLVDNLRYAVANVPGFLTMTLCPEASDAGLLNDFGFTARVLQEVGSPRLGLQFHSYHAQHTAGSAMDLLEEHGHLVRHIQIADYPGGGAPGTGQIDFGALLRCAAEHCPHAWIEVDCDIDGQTENKLGFLPGLKTC